MHTDTRQRNEEHVIVHNGENLSWVDPLVHTMVYQAVASGVDAQIGRVREYMSLMVRWDIHPHVIIFEHERI